MPVKCYPRGDFRRLEHGQPGTWTSRTVDRKRTARFCCPICKFVAYLDDHTISDDGTVSPSVDCPVCSFHEFIKLGGWSG